MDSARGNHVSRSCRIVVAAVVLSAFSLLNPVYLLGCGFRCDCEPVHTDEEVMQNFEPYAGEEHVYVASNQDGTLTLTVRIDGDSFQPDPYAKAAPNSSGTGLVTQAMACSCDNDEDILVGGVFSATFEFEDGETKQLFSDRGFDAIYLVSNGNWSTLQVELPYEVSFSLHSETADPRDLELERFEPDGFAAGIIHPGYDQ
jgi:hypothetical protein